MAAAGTGPGVESQPVVIGSWPDLPETADHLALGLRSLDVDEAVRRASDAPPRLMGRKLKYDIPGPDWRVAVDEVRERDYFFVQNFLFLANG